MTCSFARAERLLGREYHGRFLIELLQNAADASRRNGSGSEGSSVAVRITEGPEGPALLVANQGDPMNAEVVIESLGHIGASTKAQGEAIGHKGIGFKSVLELTLTPEIYSGLQQSSPALAIGFDPEKTREKMRDASPEWEEWVAEVQGLDPDDPLAAVPVLRFPHWIEELPTEVDNLRKDGFDTVVRLPFDPRFAGRLGFDSEASWIETVRSALHDDVSDQILLLLGCFDEVRLEDRLAGSKQVITTEWEQRPVEIGEGVRREVVRVWRDKDLSSRWRLFRRRSGEVRHLAGEVAVGVRVDDGSSIETVLPAVAGASSAPFHLFFPTRITSGLPFLLHAYFEVDAARTGFYRGSAQRNKAMLHELVSVSKVAVADAVQSEKVDLVSLVNCIAAAHEPDDEYARDFRSDVLDSLKDVPWIPLQAGDEVSRSDRPASVFGARSSGLIQRIGSTFPPSYIKRRTGFGLPDNGLSDAAHDLVRARSEAPDEWETTRLLCLPGDAPPWEGRDADFHFRALLGLFSALKSENDEATRTLLDGLRGDPESRIIPTVGDGGSRVLLPIPDPSERVAGQRSRLVMARVESIEGRALMPPESLDVAFLPDGLLSDTERDQAKPLGVRPFTVDEVLDRLNVIEDSREFDREALVRFLWQMLTRASRSEFSTRESASRASDFEPSEWFWCRPGHGGGTDTARERQRRERYLSAVPLPCRDGEWRPAGRIAFGADWADWLEKRPEVYPTASTRDRRIAAYRAMEKVSPGCEGLLAAPEVVLSYLGEDAFGEERQVRGDDEPGEAAARRRPDAERHAFLLRLGVWEVPPVEAYESQSRNRSRVPWSGSEKDRRDELVKWAGGWRFGHGWENRPHDDDKVYLAEDYRFLWPLEEMARRDRSALVASLGFGAKLYRERSRALFFCPQCSTWKGSHSVRRRSGTGDRYPSTLSIQLGSERWLPCTLDGERLETLSSPESAWWQLKPPQGAALRQSPWRLVPLCGPDQSINEELRHLAGIQTSENVGADAVERLLTDLKERFEAGLLPADPRRSGSARQAFIGLHRHAYEWLAGLTPAQPEAASVVTRTGVLCEVGERLEYHAPDVALHDDGRFAAYVRYFLGLGSVPFAVLARDKGAIARRLGVTSFQLELTRRGEDGGRDVTDSLRVIHGDRIAGLLAIMVHHSLGTQTLDVEGVDFDRRARRIQNLRIRQMDDLVIDARVEGSTTAVTLGEGSRQDLFLENPTSALPVLYHDLSGDRWQEQVRKKIPPYLAMVLENSAYAHTFALYLQQESDAEREEFLLELGITSEEVDAIKKRVGVVSEEEKQRHLRWFRSVLDALDSDPVGMSLDPEDLTARLENTRLSAEDAHRLFDFGGGEEVRRDIEEGSALRILDRADVDLRVLDSKLRAAARDDGLAIGAFRRLFTSWIRTNGQRLAAVLATKRQPEDAKAKVSTLSPPPELRFQLDPAMPDVLAPVAEALRSAGLEPDARGLADTTVAELVRLGGFGALEELDNQAKLLYSEEERRRILSELAAAWRREIRLFAALARTSPADTRTAIRAYDEAVTAILPDNPSSPAELRGTLGELFGRHGDFANRISACLVDTMNAPFPNRDKLLEWAGRNDVSVDLLDTVKLALEAPRRERARELRKCGQQLADAGVHPVPPRGFKEIPPRQQQPPRDGPAPVKTIKVSPKQDQIKRELGDEGERWALSAVIRDFIDLDKGDRDAAISQVEALLGRFEGPPVEKALAHAKQARMRDLDDEELVEELAGLLHVSRYSDAFGFDLIGWLPSNPSGERRAVCLEVKSSGGEGFHLSAGQWSLAEQFHETRVGGQYAVLVVRRGGSGGVPAAMDVLRDPALLLKSELIRREVDGYQIAYSAVK